MRSAHIVSKVPESSKFWPIASKRGSGIPREVTVNSITLPFEGALDTDGTVFRIRQVGPTGGSGGIALSAESYGLDRFGDTATAIYGGTDSGGTAIFGSTDSGVGVQGQSFGGAGVYGAGSTGVLGVDNTGTPDYQLADRPAGVVGHSVDNYGVYGHSANFDGVKGVSSSGAHAAVAAINTASLTGALSSFGVYAWSNGTGVYAQGNPAGYFQGDVQVTGDLILINSPASGDVAEDFDLDDDPAHAEPGTVLVINSTGRLCTSDDPYDTRVAGVVSGAGELKPALVLQRIQSPERRSPIALVGKAFCKVDASFGNVAAGDLLTTSPTRGHAMKVGDRSRALGAILGKALASLESGRGLIPILVGLR
jgi:hypothetical protein